MIPVLQKRTRYTLRGLLGLIAVVAFACFWVTWPKRTAVSFLVERHGKRTEVRNPYRDGTPEALDFLQNQKPRIVKKLQEQKLDLKKLVPHKRSVTDVLLSRQQFDFGMISFVICRGRVVWGPESFWSFPGGGRSYR